VTRYPPVPTLLYHCQQAAVLDVKVYMDRESKVNQVSLFNVGGVMSFIQNSNICSYIEVFQAYQALYRNVDTEPRVNIML